MTSDKVHLWVLECSCLAHVSVSRMLCRSPRLWGKFDLDWILGKVDQLSKLIGQFKYLGIEDLLQELLIEKPSRISRK